MRLGNPVSDLIHFINILKVKILGIKPANLELGVRDTEPLANLKCVDGMIFQKLEEPRKYPEKSRISTSQSTPKPSW